MLSSHEVHFVRLRSYAFKLGYQISTVPLWLYTKKLIAETYPDSELEDSVVVSGYSEGGYAAVSIAEALSAIEVDIISLQAGAGPYRLSSIELPFMIRKYYV